MNKHLTLIIALIILNIKLTAQVCLTPPGSAYSLTQQPFSITSADFNNDGKIDIATADRFANSVTVLFGDGNNNFLSTIEFTLSVSGPISITNGDFNEDNNIDIAIVNNSSANVTLLINDGYGSFIPSSNFPVGSAPQSITRSDFNNDGFDDLAVANNSSNNVSILLGTGTASFSAATNFPVGASPIAIIGADFNLDSQVDIAVTNYIGNNVSILLGNGAGSFGTASYFSVDSFPRSLTYSDFNLDGFVDLAVSNDKPIGTVNILLGSGTGSFTPSATYTVGTNPNFITNGDFNSDGIIDLATANSNSQNISVLPGSVSGIFGTNINFSVGTSLRTVINTDFNSDGRTDLISANFSSLSVFLNQPPPVTANSSQSNVCLGDNITLTGGGAISYTWSDGVIDGSAFIPTNTTTYTVTGTDLNGCSNNAFIIINVNTPSSLIFSPSIASICFGASADFTVSPGGTYTLSPGGNIGNIFSVSPSATTNYTIEGNDPNGCFSSSTYNVKVNEIPVASGSSNNVCENGDIILFNSSTIGIGFLTYQWDGPNAYSSTVQSPTITTVNLSMGGNYTLSVISDEGCVDNAIIPVTVYALPSLNIGGPTSICSGTNGTLSVTGAQSYTWSTNDNTSSIIITPNVSTTYSVEGEDTNGCKNNSSTFIIVNTPIPYTVSPSSPSICVGASVNFTVSPSSTYTLQPGGSSGDIFNETPTVNTTYTIQGNDINGCDITNTYDIFIHPQPIASANFNQAVICENNNLSTVNTSTINGGIISSYLWDGPNAFSSTNANFIIPNAGIPASGDYSLTVTSDQNCLDVAIISAAINPKPNVFATASATNICTSATATLTASGANTYTWSTTANSSVITVTPSANTTYTVVGENTFGCKDTTTIIINTILSKNINGIATTTAGVVNGEVTIYKFSPILSKWDSVTTVNFSPNFNFGQLDSGNYVLRAKPSASNIQTTYGNSSISWQNATILSHGCAANSSQTITLIPFANIGSGTGSMSGAITQTIGFGQKTIGETSVMVPLAPGNPIGGIIVKGGKNPGGNYFAQTETDETTGTFTITGIPNTAAGESIFIFIDIPGLDTAGTYYRSFSNGESYTGLNFIVDSAKIRPAVTQNTTDVGITENGFETSLNVYPNPVNNYVNITFDLKSNSNVKIELIDILGKSILILEDEKNMTAKKYVNKYNFHHISEGAYFIKINIQDNIIYRKILITR